MSKANVEVRRVLVAPGDDLPKQKARIAPDQRVFSHDYNLSLEFFAQSLFGDRYHKSVNQHGIAFWKKFYISAFEVLQASISTSIGSVDPEHRRDIEQHLDRSLRWLRESETKDKIHGALIVSLFKLVFLLLGRLPYATRGKRRNLSTFRTLTYSQTDEQLSYLLEVHMQRRRKDYGFEISSKYIVRFVNGAKLTKNRSATDIRMSSGCERISPTPTRSSASPSRRFRAGPAYQKS